MYVVFKKSTFEFTVVIKCVKNLKYYDSKLYRNLIDSENFK